MDRGTETIFTTINGLLPSSMRYGQFRYYWLALLVNVPGHQMLLPFTMGWLVVLVIAVLALAFSADVRSLRAGVTERLRAAYAGSGDGGDNRGRRGILKTSCRNWEGGYPHGRFQG